MTDGSVDGAVRLYERIYSEHPAALYAELRRDHGPIVPVLLENDVFAWLVIGYRELHRVLTDPQLFPRDSRVWNKWGEIPPDWPLMPFIAYQPSMFFGEGSEHQSRYEAVERAFASIDPFELQLRCERIADTLIDDFAGRGEADLLADYAYSMPVLVLAEMLGVPGTRLESVARDLVEALDTGEGALAAHGRVVAAMHDLVSMKRESPGTDLASRIVTTHPGTAEEIAQDLLVVMVTGQEPVANWIGNTLRLMLTDDRFSLTLSGGRRSVGQALNEVLWEDGPVQNDVGRWAARDTELAGRRIRAGDMLIIGMAGANTDPHVRPGSPTGISGNQAHLAFGHGSHGCPQSTREAAEVIVRTAVEVLLDRLPDVLLSVPAEDLVWRPSFHVRGLTGLPARFSPALAVGGR
ncbi:cytochrome P450 [Actinoallomurus sp. CA-142502]|uniref:cytochrome P450 n=1 Tax=Actinoallomurus sp. CA-142502 TaxID=3239885 RepID=UPI003D92E346